jgi:PAS domain S-box-containing protein
MNSYESTILDALQGAAIIVDENGNITFANNKWDNGNDSLMLTENTPLEENYFKHCRLAIEEGNDYALQLLFGTREVLNGRKKSFNITIMLPTTGKKKWYKVEVSPIDLHSKNHALLLFHDVSGNMNRIKYLRDSEALYRQNFKYSTSGIIFGKRNGDILDVNPAACKILGYNKQELIEGGRSMIVDEDDPAHKEVVRTRNEKSVFKGEKEYKHKEGHYVPVQLISVSFRSENGEEQIINTFQDIQHEKLNQHTLAEERRFTKTALNCLPGIFFVIDSDRKFVRWNESLHTNLGYSEEEMMDKTVLDIFAPAEQVNIQSFLDEAFKNGQMEFNGKIISKKTGFRDYQLYFNTFESSEKRYLVVTGIDKTELVESEKVRDQNHQLMTELFDNSPIAAVMINPKNEAQKINSAFIDLFGYSEKELLGRNINTLITNKELQKEADEISRFAFNGSSDQRKTIRFTKNGNVVPSLLSTVPVRSNGDIIAVYGMYIDLTEQVKLENHLQKSLEEKDILLQEVHHRVKNNLAIIASLLQLQIINDSNELAKPKLQEAYSRIFSIAKIHENLYNSDNVAEISFPDYLNSIIETMPNVARSSEFDLNINVRDSPLMLNVNQAVPLGLLINELVHLTPHTENEYQKAELNYCCEGENVTITISGLDKQAEDFSSESEETEFHQLLIETFLRQIDANIDIVKNHRDKFVITFQKMNSEEGANHNSITNHKSFN